MGSILPIRAASHVGSDFGITRRRQNTRPLSRLLPWAWSRCTLGTPSQGAVMFGWKSLVSSLARVPGYIWLGDPLGLLMSSRTASEDLSQAPGVVGRS